MGSSGLIIKTNFASLNLDQNFSENLWASTRPVSNPTRGSYRRVEPDPTILLGPVPYYLQTVNVKMQGNK